MAKEEEKKEEKEEISQEEMDEKAERWARLHKGSPHEREKRALIEGLKPGKKPPPPPKKEEGDIAKAAKEAVEYSKKGDK